MSRLMYVYRTTQIGRDNVDSDSLRFAVSLPLDELLDDHACDSPFQT
jgi:hypothetical protein